MIASELKVYRDTYELVSLIADIQTGFPRLYRYSIGQKMLSVSLELFEYIQLANMYKESRIKYLTGFTIKFELVKSLVRLASDKHLINLKQEASIARRTNTIGKQITAWKNAAASHSSRGGQ